MVMKSRKINEITTIIKLQKEKIRRTVKCLLLISIKIIFRTKY